MHPDLAEYGPIRFHSDPNALYDRHLLFDYAIDPDLATPRERYEAVARSLRDVLAIRWLKTKKTQYRANPKHAYYLSMEFLIGRSLASNVSNLLLDPAMLEACRERTWTGMNYWTRSPTQDLEMAAWDAWPRALLNPWQHWSCRRWVTACATSMEFLSSRFAMAGKMKNPTTGCGDRIRGR